MNYSGILILSLLLIVFLAGCVTQKSESTPKVNTPITVEQKTTTQVTTQVNNTTGPKVYNVDAVQGIGVVVSPS